MSENGVGTIVNVSASYASCERVVNMVKDYPFMYAAVGIHPDEVGDLNETSFARMKELFQRDKVVAVGEIGRGKIRAVSLQNDCLKRYLLHRFF